MIHRAEHKKGYLVCDKGFLKDKDLSLKAKGLLAIILAQPDDYKLTISGLTKSSKDGESSTKSGLKELQEKGYISFKEREGGKFAEREMVVYEIPLENHRTSENHGISENHGHISTEPFPPPIENFMFSNNKKKIPPRVEEVAEYCKERNNGIDAETFVDFYQSKNWKVGNTKMTDWKAAVRTWERRRKKERRGERTDGGILDEILK